MAERVLGKRGSPRRRHLLILPILVTATVALFLITGAQAVHDDNLFELGPAQGANILGDGNAANGPDWAYIFDADGDAISSFAAPRRRSSTTTLPARRDRPNDVLRRRRVEQKQ